MLIQFYDGQYKEQIEYIKMYIELKNYTKTDKSIKLEGADISVRKQYLRLFTRMEDESCIANITMDFKNKFGSTIEGTLHISSDNKD